MSAPLYEKLKNYEKKGLYPFYMPGHKNGRLLNDENAFKYDLTELRGLDNLHQSTGLIKEAEALAAKTFGAKESYFLVNGSSSGLEAAVFSSLKPYDEIIIARNCHISVYHGALLAHAKTRFIYPKVIEPYGIASAITCEEVKEAIKNYPKAKAIVITSPTYEGLCSDIKSISKLADENDMILIVDEAHGPHFKFSDYFPETALSQNADIVVQSTHKTLPALTGSAMLHTQGEKVNSERIKKSLSIFQTTSPSYIKMGILDYVRNLLDNRADELFEGFVEKLEHFRTECKNLKCIKLLDESDLKGYEVHDFDKSKLVFLINSNEINASDIDDKLYNDYKIEIEMSSLKHLIAMTSIADTEEGFDRLLIAIKELDEKYDYQVINNRRSFRNFDLKEKFSITEAFYKDKIEEKFENLENKVSANFLIPYPPGIAIINPGEVFTKELLDYLNLLLEKNILIVGLEDKKAFVIS